MCTQNSPKQITHMSTGATTTTGSTTSRKRKQDDSFDAPPKKRTQNHQATPKKTSNIDVIKNGCMRAINKTKGCINDDWKYGVIYDKVHDKFDTVDPSILLGTVLSHVTVDEKGSGDIKPGCFQYNYQHSGNSISDCGLPMGLDTARMGLIENFQHFISLAQTHMLHHGYTYDDASKNIEKYRPDKVLDIDIKNDNYLTFINMLDGFFNNDPFKHEKNRPSVTTTNTQKQNASCSVNDEELYGSQLNLDLTPFIFTPTPSQMSMLSPIGTSQWERIMDIDTAGQEVAEDDTTTTNEYAPLEVDHSAGIDGEPTTFPSTVTTQQQQHVDEDDAPTEDTSIPSSQNAYQCSLGAFEEFLEGKRMQEMLDELDERTVCINDKQRTVLGAFMKDSSYYLNISNNSTFKKDVQEKDVDNYAIYADSYLSSILNVSHGKRAMSDVLTEFMYADQQMTSSSFDKNSKEIKKLKKSEKRNLLTHKYNYGRIISSLVTPIFYTSSMFDDMDDRELFHTMNKMYDLEAIGAVKEDGSVDFDALNAHRLVWSARIVKWIDRMLSDIYSYLICLYNLFTMEGQIPIENIPRKDWKLTKSLHHIPIILSIIKTIMGDGDELSKNKTKFSRYGIYTIHQRKDKYHIPRHWSLDRRELYDITTIISYVHSIYDPKYNKTQYKEEGAQRLVRATKTPSVNSKYYHEHGYPHPNHPHYSNFYN